MDAPGRATAGVRRIVVQTARLLGRYDPESVTTETMEGYAVPVATRPSRELLGFAPQHTWRRP